jgi:hypothetical protein
MLPMSSLKLTLNHIIIFVFLVLGLFQAGMAISVALPAMQLALSIDQKLAVSKAPVLNQQSLEAALKVIGNTQPLPSSQTKAPAAVASNSAVAKPNTPSRVEVVNASGVVGAAKQISQLFGASATVDLKNSQGVTAENSISYKSDFRDTAAQLQGKMQSLGWPVAKLTQKGNNEIYDISIVIFKNDRLTQ